jgi:hypothetical protein
MRDPTEERDHAQERDTHHHGVGAPRSVRAGVRPRLQHAAHRAAQIDDPSAEPGGPRVRTGEQRDEQGDERRREEPAGVSEQAAQERVDDRTDGGLILGPRRIHEVVRRRHGESALDHEHERERRHQLQERPTFPRRDPHGRHEEHDEQHRQQDHGLVEQVDSV